MDYPRLCVLRGDQHPGTSLTIMECRSGWFVGFKDPSGQPYSRESQFFRTKNGALGCLSTLRSSVRTRK